MSPGKCSNRRVKHGTQLDRKAEEGSGKAHAQVLGRAQANGYQVSKDQGTAYWETEAAKAWRLHGRQRASDTTREVVNIAAFIGMVVALVALLPPAVEANRPSEILGLARICVSESGWDSPHDCEGILSVLRSRSERTGMTLNQAMRAYSKRVFDRSRTDARRWIADLHLSAQKPDGWPDHLPWDGGYKESWMMMLEFAEDLLGSSNLRCSAHHWGDRYGDKERALRAGWTEVDCGETKNMFWRTR